MTKIRVIRTEEQYLEYLANIEDIILKGDKASPSEIESLELMSVVVAAYEKSSYPIDPIDPIEAIRFRLHEKGLKQADLIPLIGTSGRVSEILSRKRPLTVSMIRALSQGLGISADVLVGAGEFEGKQEGVDWSKFPVREILSRGWLGDVMTLDKISVAHSIQSFIETSGLKFEHTRFRRTLVGDADSPTATYSLYAWLARVIQKARDQEAHLPAFDVASISSDFLRELAQLSWLQSGPALAVEFLQKHGIAVVFETHLRGTNLDGAALKDINGRPIIGLTLRYDRIDNFWFTILHELAHIWKHLPDSNVAFVDDTTRQSENKFEAEANRIASESFIPRLVWRRSDAYLRADRSSIENLARQLRIHPAIIVGRIQRERGDYSILRDVLGQGDVSHILKGIRDDD
jgi:HTH-type transcriptional regulator/antitoxin HigA